MQRSFGVRGNVCVDGLRAATAIISSQRSMPLVRDPQRINM